MKRWVSGLHRTPTISYGHKNIVAGVSDWKEKNGCRPFGTIEEMNYTLISAINSFVGQDDILIHLGDWSFGGVENITKFRKQLIVKNIHLVLGNHDQHIKNKNFLNELFTSVNPYLELMVDKQMIVACHFPICSWNRAHDGTWMLHGHSHGTLFKDEGINHWYKKSKILDVGVDNVLYYKPLHYKEIVNIMKKRDFISIDQHDEETNG